MKIVILVILMIWSQKSVIVGFTKNNDFYDLSRKTMILEIHDLTLFLV